LREIDVRILLEGITQAQRTLALDDVRDETATGPFNVPISSVSKIGHTFRNAPGGFPLRGLLLEALALRDAGTNGIHRAQQVLDRDLLDLQLLVAADLLGLQFRPSFRLIDVEGGYEIL
jgi:hypothetical protein